MLSITMAAMTVKKSFLLFSLLQLSFQDVCSVPLLDGAFSTTDDVDGFLRFGLDISSIQQEIIDIEQRKDIYTNVSNKIASLSFQTKTKKNWMRHIYCS